MAELNQRGSVVAIYIAPRSSVPMEARQTVRAITGSGLEGDRYSEGTGYYSGDPVWDADVTLIELDAIEEVNQRYDLSIDWGAPRRNIVTRGVSLESLVGRDFRVGDALLRGLKPWPPCSHLARLVGSQSILHGFAHCGGIGASVLRDGAIRVGDAITVSDESS